jgi:hypothetical protein
MPTPVATVRRREGHRAASEAAPARPAGARRLHRPVFYVTVCDSILGHRVDRSTSVLIIRLYDCAITYAYQESRERKDTKSFCKKLSLHLLYALTR